MRKGAQLAHIKWIKCWDINSISRKLKRLNNTVHTINAKIASSHTAVCSILSEEEMELFIFECEQESNKARLAEEIEIDKKFRPSNMNYNTKALINRTQCTIPEDIQIGLSFGWKFLFPYTTNNDNIHEILAQIDHCIEGSTSTLAQHEAFLETARIISNKKDFEDDPNIQWLKFISQRTADFFEMNNEIFATRSDKGGHTVIIRIDEYDKAITEMLNDETVYKKSREKNPLEIMIQTESKLINTLKNNHKAKWVATEIYEPNTKQIARFYGLPKIHKDDFKLRPIVSLRHAPGHALGKMFNRMLNECFPTSELHVRDVYEIKKFLDNAVSGPNMILASYDAKSMYTSIARELVKDIILEASEIFLEIFGIGREILIGILNFLLENSVYFTAVGTLYKQIQGLPMGGCISTALARIVMDRTVAHVQSMVTGIHFIKVFVDDTLTLIDFNKQIDILNALNSFHPQLQFTIEEENDRQEINFLNLTARRTQNGISTNWYRKSFASGRLLNFFSSHKRTTIINTAENFIKTVLFLSDPEYFNSNKPKVIDTLRDNSFPETTIMALLNKHYTYMKPIRKNIVLTDEEMADCHPYLRAKNATREEEKETEYRVFPQAMCRARKIKKVLHRLRNPNVVFAESTRNTKINHVTTRKTRIQLKNRGNIIVVTQCKCKSKCKIKPTTFNQTGIQLWENELRTTFGRCSANKHAFRRAKFIRGLFYQSQTRYLARYIAHKYSGSVTDNGIGLPNRHFLKILRRANDNTEMKKNKLFA